MILQSGGETVGYIVIVGVAAFGVVDSLRSLFPFIDRIGIGYILRTITSLTPESGESPSGTGLHQKQILGAIEARWIIGEKPLDQKDFAASLTKTHLNPANAAAVASVTNLDKQLLTSAAAKLKSVTPLTIPEQGSYTQFELTVASMIDEAFLRSVRANQNGMRILSAGVCVALSLVCGWVLNERTLEAYLYSGDMCRAILLGLAAVPVVPVARDVSTAVGTAIRSKIQKSL